MRNNMANAANNPATSAYSAETGVPIVQWYGERGIVNSIVTFISTPQSEVAGKTAQLLKAIKWCNGAQPQWIDDIQSVTYIVELGLAQFGDPDLLVVVRTNSDEKPKLICVEAKVIPYRESMRPNHEGMRESGFNSSINGQLSLKYRFAKTLESLPSSGIPSAIEEPSAIFTSYQGSLQDKNKEPRKLEKESIIRNILYTQELIGLQEENVYYVAFTWDDNRHIFFEDPLVTAKEQEFMPLFIDDKGKRVLCKQWTRVGWLGYLNLEQLLQGLGQDPSYCNARRTMLSNNTPQVEHYEDPRLKPMKQWPPSVKSLSVSLWKYIKERFPMGYSITPCKGSYSVKDSSGEVVAKIIPQYAGVFVGIRESRFSKLPANQEVISFNVKNVKFVGTLVAPSEGINEAGNWLESLL